jgi:hypothetical protein
VELQNLRFGVSVVVCVSLGEAAQTQPVPNCMKRQPSSCPWPCPVGHLDRVRACRAEAPAGGGEAADHREALEHGQFRWRAPPPDVLGVCKEAARPQAQQTTCEHTPSEDPGNSFGRLWGLEQIQQSHSQLDSLELEGALEAPGRNRSKGGDWQSISELDACLSACTDWLRAFPRELRVAEAMSL